MERGERRVSVAPHPRRLPWSVLLPLVFLVLRVAAQWATLGCGAMGGELEARGGGRG